MPQFSSSCCDVSPEMGERMNYEAPMMDVITPQNNGCLACTICGKCMLCIMWFAVINASNLEFAIGLAYLD